MATRVITERLLVRAARGDNSPAGIAEDDLARLCERRDRLVFELDRVEEQMRTTAQRPGATSVI